MIERIFPVRQYDDRRLRPLHKDPGVLNDLGAEIQWIHSTYRRKTYCVIPSGQELSNAMHRKADFLQTQFPR